MHAISSTGFKDFFMKTCATQLTLLGKLLISFTECNFNRGSPDVHILLWIKDAPTAESNTAEEISEFVDKYVTCSK